MHEIYKPFIKKFPVVEHYKPPDTHIIFNEGQRSLKPIRVRLPDPPPLDTITGFGLPPREQMWKQPQMPIRLKELERTCATLEEIHLTLEKNQKSYSDEIKWIEEEWNRRINGHWLYINGKPTYIDGWHYFYCGYWNLDIGLPEYRSRDRKFFLFARFCWTDTTMPDGHDLERRVCLGFNFPKFRREGATFKGECINYELCSRYPNVHGGIQSLDDTSGKKVFQEKLVNPWRKLPFFFTPYFNTSTSPAAKIGFDITAKAVSGKGSVLVKTEGLGSYIDYATTASKDYYDGDKLIFYHDDETGKAVREDVYKRHEVVRKCLVQGNSRSIHGLTIKTSTVGEMDDSGGKNFYNLCKASMWEKRNDNGMTTTGLYNLFIPSSDGLDTFIDIFGESIIDDPLEEDLWRIPTPTRDISGKLIGAKTYLENQRIAYLSAGEDIEAQIRYEENVRQFPETFEECFISAGSGSGLNLVKIVNRMKELQFGQNNIRRGNFVWRTKDGIVDWVDNDKGRWENSLVLNNEKQQEKYKTKVWEESGWVETWAPKYPNKFTASADPYQFLKTESNKESLSYGAGAVFWHQDKDIDPDSKPIDEWQSHRTVCTYLNRPPDPDDFAEDMLMMSIYYGAMSYYEINIPLLWLHHKRRGYLGYLKYYIGPDGRKKNTPGFYNKGAIPQELFNAHKRFIELHCHREQHLSILEQCYSIKNVTELTTHDLFVAVGGAYLGAEIEIDERLLPHNRKQVNLSQFVHAKTY